MKPKPPRWLTQSFADGVDERIVVWTPEPPPAYPGAFPHCWLAQFDERRRPCELPFERAHLIPRQRVENALYALLPDPITEMINVLHPSQSRDEVAAELGDVAAWHEWRRDLILLAAWDPRNGVVSCEAHHRRLDGARMPPLLVPQADLPPHALEFAKDWGLESALNDRFSPF